MVTDSTFHFQIQHYDAVLAYYRQPSDETWLALLEAVRPGAGELDAIEYDTLGEMVSTAMHEYEDCIAGQSNLQSEMLQYLALDDYPAPTAYTRQRICEEYWHCTPEAFDRQKLSDYLNLLTIRRAQAIDYELDHPKKPFDEDE